MLINSIFKKMTLQIILIIQIIINKTINKTINSIIQILVIIIENQWKYLVVVIMINHLVEVLYNYKIKINKDNQI